MQWLAAACKCIVESSVDALLYAATDGVLGCLDSVVGDASCSFTHRLQGLAASPPPTHPPTHTLKRTQVIKQTGHGRPADIWSVGCTVIEMATGKPPWSNYAAPVAAMFQIASSKDPPPIPDHLSPQAKDFLLMCFNRCGLARRSLPRGRSFGQFWVGGQLRQRCLVF